MADDLNLTPAGGSRPPAPTPPAASGPAAEEPTTAEIVAVVTGSDGDATIASSPSPAPPSPAAPTSPAGPSAPAADGKAAAPTSPVRPPAPAAAGATPPRRAPVSNDTPTITRPARRPVPPRTPPAAPTLSPAPPRPLTPPVAAPATRPQPARPESDWAAEVADRIDEVVAKVRANTSERLVGVARIVVFGLLAAVMGITALVLVLILFFRLLAVIPGPVWIPYLAVGAISVALGLLCWSKRTAKPSPT